MVEVDWMRFYAMHDDELNRLVHGKKLMTNEDAVRTGLLRCKYLYFLIFLALVPVFVLFNYFADSLPISLINYIFSSAWTGSRVGCC